MISIVFIFLLSVSAVVAMLFGPANQPSALAMGFCTGIAILSFCILLGAISAA
jgi:hypothetical protein